MSKSIFCVVWGDDDLPDEGWYHNRAEAEANSAPGVRVVEYVPAAKLSAAEERDRWREPDSEVPAPGDMLSAGDVFEVILFENSDASLDRMVTLCIFHEGRFLSLGGISYELDDVLCWRPARPVGELPIPKEET